MSSNPAAGDARCAASSNPILRRDDAAVRRYDDVLFGFNRDTDFLGQRAISSPEIICL
jgi:hypothetical protein